MDNEEKLARLTEREKVCLRQWLQHKSAKEIAADLHISHHAVEKRLKMARTKLGTTSSLQAARLLSQSEGYGRTVPQTPDLHAHTLQPQASYVRPLMLGATAMTLVAAALFVLLPSMGEDPLHSETVVQVRKGDEQLESALNILIAAATVGPDGEVVLTNPLGDQRYLQPHSGHYWQISAAGHHDLPSRSLWDRTLKVRGRKALSEPLFYNSNEFPREPLRVAQRSIFLPGSDVEWQFLVAQSLEVPD